MPGAPSSFLLLVAMSFAPSCQSTSLRQLKHPSCKTLGTWQGTNVALIIGEHALSRWKPAVEACRIGTNAAIGSMFREPCSSTSNDGY